jgi:hypothetical protein
MKAGENWRLTRNLQETAKKWRQIINRKSGSGYSLTIFSQLGSVSVAADAYHAKDGKTNAENVNRLLLRSWTLSSE